MGRLFLFCAVLAIAPAPATRCEIIHGLQTLPPAYINAEYGPIPWDAGFDFSTQLLVYYESDEANIFYGENIRGDGWHFHASGSEVGLLWVSTLLEDVHVAPAFPGGVSPTQAVALDRTYVTKTGDGLYAKFAVRVFNDGYGGDDEGCCSLVIEYYVQMDGSPSFDPSNPVRSSTWGGVKALYR